MGYGIITILFLGCLCLYLITNDRLKQCQSELNRKDESIAFLEQVRNNLCTKDNQNYIQTKDDFKYIIIKQLEIVHKKGLYISYSIDDLCQMILDNGYIIGVEKIQDINFEHFEKTVKAELYANDGYLSIFQGDRYPQYRLGKHGEHIPLTDDEIDRMENYDFQFIYDSLRLF
jgi:hypothetical protein